MSAEIERPIGQTNASVQKLRKSIPWLWEGVYHLEEEASRVLEEVSKSEVAA